MKKQVVSVAALLFFSGACALIYQTAWLREFRLIFGATTTASAAVLAIFMGGLGIGGIFLGRRADAHRRPLELYGKLELIVAAVAALSPLLLVVASFVYITLGGTETMGVSGGTIVRLILSTLVLGVATVAMGGTLPAAVRAVETTADLDRRHLALIYGVNTLGAVAGALASTFFLLEIFGNRKTIWIAALLNVAVALLAIRMARSTPEQEPEPVVMTATGTARVPVFPLAAAAIVGFAFLLMELVWYRMLTPILGGTTFTFGLILAVALFGIGVGGAACSIGFSRRRTVMLFAGTCMLEALMIAVPYALGDRIAIAAGLIRPFMALGFYGFIPASILITAAVVFAAAVIAGYQFPVLIALMGEGREDVGRHVGMAYAANTAGAIAGSLAGGFGLLPLLSAQGTWRLVVYVLVALGTAGVILGLRQTRFVRAILPLAFGVLAIALTFATGPTTAWRHSGIGAGRTRIDVWKDRNSIQDWTLSMRRNVAWESEGVESSVAVTASDGFAFFVNGKSDGHAVADAGTQVMGGLLGAILHPNPRRALVVGLGTGSTAGWLGVVPSIDVVDVVELEPAILEVAKLCSPVNENALENPKVNVRIGDGRELLLTTAGKYDLIFSEPSNPYRAGIATLYTADFYRHAAQRLAAEGIFIQWLQAYEVDAETISTVYATLKSVFPYVETWHGRSEDLLLVSSMTPRRLSAEELRRRVAAEPFATALRRAWYVEGLEGFLSRFVARTTLADAIALSHELPLNTDDRTVIEFAFARSLGTTPGFSIDSLRALAIARGEDRPLIEGAVDWRRVELQRLSAQLVERVAIGGVSDRTLAPRVSVYQSFIAGDLERAGRSWLEAFEPMNRAELLMLAEIYVGLNDPRGRPIVDELRVTSPSDADAYDALFAEYRGDRESAVRLLEKAFNGFRVDPWFYEAAARRAITLALTLSTASPDLGVAQRMHAALAQPFAVERLRAERWAALGNLAQKIDGGRCGRATVQAFEMYEPNPQWQETFLKRRALCYDLTGHRLRDRAREELEEYVDGLPLPLAIGIPVGN